LAALQVILASAFFGLASFAFAKGVHLVKNFSLRWIKTGWLIPFAAGSLLSRLPYFGQARLFKPRC
jgi:H+/Cl- antiporter ClcA